MFTTQARPERGAGRGASVRRSLLLAGIARSRLVIARSRLVKVCVSVGLLAYILLRVDLRNLGSLLASLDAAFVPLLMGLFVLFVALGGLRVSLILRATASGDLATRVVVERYFLANAVGAFTPAQAGEFSLGYLLRDRGLDVGRGVAAVLLDKLIMLALFLVCSAVAALVFFDGSERALPIGLSVFAAVAAVCALVRPVRQGIRHGIVEPYFPRLVPIGHMVVDFLLFRRRALALNVLLALVRIGISGLTIHVGLRALGHTSADLVDVLLLNGLVRTVTFLPISVNGIGVLEGAAMKAFSAAAIGVSEEMILSAFLVNRAIAYLYSGSVVVWHLFRRREGRVPVKRIA